MVLVLAVAIVTGGCVSRQQYDEVRAQNRIQQQRVTDLEGELGSCQLQLAQSGKQMETLQGRNSAELVKVPKLPHLKRISRAKSR